MKVLINNQYIDIINAKRFKQRLIGLLGQPVIKKGMLFRKCNSVHTFFMSSNIDIIALNTDNQVLAIYQNVKPFKLIKINHPNKKTSILELPPNTSQNIRINDTILFQ